jgi:hypothetical protein
MDAQQRRQAPVVYFLPKMIWTVPDFSVDRYLDRFAIWTITCERWCRSWRIPLAR